MFHEGETAVVKINVADPDPVEFGFFRKWIQIQY
jgi:hypothetical protein